MKFKKHNMVKLKSGEEVYVTHVRVAEYDGKARGIYGVDDNPNLVFETYFEQNEVVKIIAEIGENPHMNKFKNKKD